MSWASTGGQVGQGPRMTRPAPTSTAGRGPVLAHTALMTVVLVAGSVVVTTLSYFTAGASGSVGAYAVMQTALTLVVVAYLVRWRTVAGLRRGVPALPWAGVAGVLAYLLTPASWTGTALFWWQLLEPGPLAFVLDLPVWLVAVALGVLWASSQQQLVRQATPYG